MFSGSRAALISILILLTTGLAVLLPATSWARRGDRCAEIFAPAIAEPWRSLYKAGTVEVGGRTAYYESLRAAAGKPTVLLFIGAYTPLQDIASFQKSFAAQANGAGLIVYAYSTAMESLVANREKSREKSLSTKPAIALDDFVSEATAALNAVRPDGNVTVVGYSFGSAPAAKFAMFHRERVAHLVFVSPFVTQGEHSPVLLASKSATESLAFYNPIVGPTILEGVRDRSARETAKSWTDRTYNQNPVVRWVGRETATAAIAAQIRTVDEFNLRDENMSQWPRTHFLLAGRDNASRFELQNEVVSEWTENLRTNPKRKGVVRVIKRAEHAMLTEEPEMAARLILEISRRRP